MNCYELTLKQYSGKQELDLQGELWVDIGGDISGHLRDPVNGGVQNEIRGTVNMLPGTISQCGPPRLEFTRESYNYVLLQTNPNSFDLSGIYEGTWKSITLPTTNENLEKKCTAVLQSRQLSMPNPRS